jgi:tripartite-type tricarboxylate transporter receptor subunit TctC
MEKVMKFGRLIIGLAAISTTVVAAIPIASAQMYPSRPINIVVPFPAGGATDIATRILAERMRASLGQPVVVENISGVGGTTAVARVARAAPDGYVLSLGDWTSHVSSSAIFPIQYDVMSDLEPVALLASGPQLFVGRSTVPAKDLAELIDWLKTQSNQASLALPGTLGSGGHISGLVFQNAAGVRFRLVPYRGGAPAIQDLVAGHVDLLFVGASAALPYVRSGQIKAFGVTTESRWAAAPDIPTLSESGVSLYFSLWQGLWAPKNTPKNVIEKLNAAVVDALADAALRQRFADFGQEIPPRAQQTPEALGVHHRAEIGKWWPIIKAAGIKVE